jgi:hypothetical protein
MLILKIKKLKNVFLKSKHYTTKHALILFFIPSEKHGIKTISIESFF